MKSVSVLTEEILSRCNAPPDLSLEAAARVRSYVRQYLLAIKRGAAPVLRLVNEEFLLEIGPAEEEEKGFLEGINRELRNLRSCDIGSVE